MSDVISSWHKAGLAALLLLVGPPLSQAVPPGGTIRGTVRLGKVPPAPAATAIAKDTSVCGKEARDESVRLGKDRELADVVVFLRGARPASPPPPTPNAALDQVGCRYTPRVQAVTLGTPFTLLNNDAVFHNVHANLVGGAPNASAERPVTVFNLAMPLKGQKLPTVLKKPGILKVRCDAGHTWMTAWIHVFDHPWFAVTDGAGRFSIKDVPAGKYTLEYWHEPIHGQGLALVKAVPVEVGASATVNADAVLAL